MRELVWVRCIERLTIVGSAAFVVFLGYRLYTIGATQGESEFSYEGMLLKGTGPGLLFMLGGIFLLWRVLRTPHRITLERGEDGSELTVLGQPEKPADLEH